MKISSSGLKAENTIHMNGINVGIGEDRGDDVDRDPRGLEGRTSATLIFAVSPSSHLSTALMYSFQRLGCRSSIHLRAAQVCCCAAAGGQSRSTGREPGRITIAEANPEPELTEGDVDDLVNDRPGVHQCRGVVKEEVFMEETLERPDDRGDRRNRIVGDSSRMVVYLLLPLARPVDVGGLRRRLGRAFQPSHLHHDHVAEGLPHRHNPDSRDRARPRGPTTSRGFSKIRIRTRAC